MQLKHTFYDKLFSWIYGHSPTNTFLTWNWLFTRKNRFWFKKFKKLFEGKTVVDYGCGECPYFPYIQERVSHYTALDFEGRHVPEHPKLAFVPFEATGKIPDSVAPSELLLSIQVLVEVPSISDYLQQADKVLLPQGYMMITNPWGMPATGNNDRMRVSPFYVVKTLQEMGYTIAHYEPSGYFFSGVALSLNLLLVNANQYDIFTSTAKTSKIKWVLFTPLVAMNNILALVLDLLIPFKRSPANWILFAQKP